MLQVGQRKFDCSHLGNEHDDHTRCYTCRYAHQGYHCSGTIRCPECHHWDESWYKDVVPRRTDVPSVTREETLVAQITPISTSNLLTLPYQEWAPAVQDYSQALMGGPESLERPESQERPGKTLSTSGGSGKLSTESEGSKKQFTQSRSSEKLSVGSRDPKQMETLPKVPSQKAHSSRTIKLIRSSDVSENNANKSLTSLVKVSKNLPPTTTGNQLLRIPTYGTPERQSKTFKRHSNTASKSGPEKVKKQNSDIIFTSPVHTSSHHSDYENEPLAEQETSRHEETLIPETDEVPINMLPEKSKQQFVTTDILDQKMNTLINKFDEICDNRERNMTHMFAKLVDSQMHKVLPSNIETPSVHNLTRAESSFHSENEEAYELTDNETYQENEERAIAIIPEEDNFLDMSGESDVSEVSREKKLKADYISSLRYIFKVCPEAQGSETAPPPVTAARNALQYATPKPRKQFTKIKSAPCLVSQFEKHHRKLFDTRSEVTDPMKNVFGRQALVTKNQFIKTSSGTQKFHIADDPFALRPDHVPVPEKYQYAQANWVDKLCTELNYCEWAQLATVKLLRGMKGKYGEFPQIVSDIDDIGKIMNLTGSNLSKAEESAAALKTNVVLEQRDRFLKETYNEIPKNLKELSRIQPIFGHPELIGKPIAAMAKTLVTSQTQLAVQALKKFSQAVPRGGSSYRSSKPRDKSTGDRRPNSSTFVPSKSTVTPSVTTAPRGGHSSSSRGRGFSNRGGRGRGNSKPYVNHDKKR